MELKLYIKQATVLDKSKDDIFYDGTTPQNLVATKIKNKPFPNNRKFPDYPNFIDVTGAVSDLYKLKLTWTQDKDSDGVSTPGASQAQKSASGTLTFEGEAFQLIKQWLIDDVSAPLNSISVKIQHVGCGEYLEYAIKAPDVNWCENEVCTFDVTLKQQEERLNCIKSTLISDNHLGWFTPDISKEAPIDAIAADRRRHPRFSYCNEARPNGMLVMVWWMSATISAPILLVLIPLLGTINLVIKAINGIIGIVKKISNFFSGNKNKVDWEKIPEFDFNEMLESYGAFFVESAGCGREHPAPLIRTYIENVCKKCSVEVTPESAPIFFAEYMDVETSSRGIINVKNPHYNACYLFAEVNKGVRRYQQLNAFSNQYNKKDYFIPDNSPLLTLDWFLDELKTVYNADWRLKDGVLYFQRKDWFKKNEYIYDFTEHGADRPKLLEGVCFEWNERKYPAYTEGLYSSDAADTSGNNAKRNMNDYVGHGNTDDNPNFEGKLDKTIQYGATKFRLDGIDVDYLYDAFQVVVNGSVFTPYLAGVMFDYVYRAIDEFADYALLLSDENTTMPKILLWDGVSRENARCIRPYAASYEAGNLPPINETYNTNKVPWYEHNKAITDVRGAKLTFPKSKKGYYFLSDISGARKVIKEPMLMNYYMYFAPGYMDSLWDWFHWIDDPKKTPVMNMTWKAKIELCCDELKEKDSEGNYRLNVLKEASEIVLGEKVKLPLKYYQDGRISEIEVSYDPTENIGQHIVLKGTV